MLCSELTLVKDLGDRLMVEPLPCNSWGCKFCRPKRTQRLIAQAINGNPSAFITLTCNPNRHAHPEDAARALVKAWRQVRRKAIKKYGYDDIPFLSVIEVTKRGWPHLHILARVTWIDQKWLSRQMAKAIGAPIVDIRRVEGKRNIARYVAKYVGKAPMKIGTLKRYWKSQAWEIEDADEVAARAARRCTCYVLNRRFTSVIRDYNDLGWAIDQHPSWTYVIPSVLIQDHYPGLPNVKRE